MAFLLLAILVQCGSGPGKGGASGGGFASKPLIMLYVNGTAVETLI